MKKRIFRAAASIALSLGIALSAAVTADADSGKIYIWRGRSELKSGQDYSIRSDITVSKDLVIPENTTLYVRNGASLIISDGATLTVNGKVKINTGGLCRSWGDIEISDGAVLSLFGTLIVREGGALRSGGLLSVYENGYLNNMGDISSGEGASLIIRGQLFNRAGANLELLSGCDVKSTGYMRNYGAIYIAKGTETLLSGKINLPDSGFIDIKGTLDVEKGAVINGTGYIVLAKLKSLVKNGSVSVEVRAPEIEYINGAAYVGGVLLVTPEYPLPETYGSKINDEAYVALLRMRKDSGYTMSIISGFRSYEQQDEVFTFWAAAYGEKIASTISARAGTSEHQSGLAFDITSLEAKYADSDEGKWIAQNCHKYGFIVRYPKGKDEHTGYAYEPWHIRYVGVEIATEIYESGLCLEEYLGVA